MSALGNLNPAGWACSDDGEIENGVPQSSGDSDAHFKHSQSLEAEDVWRMKVVAGRYACVGIAGEGYDVERYEQTYMNTAKAWLSSEVRADGG